MSQWQDSIENGRQNEANPTCFQQACKGSSEQQTTTKIEVKSQTRIKKQNRNIMHKEQTYIQH